MSKLIGFQGGAYCEVFSAQGKDPTSACAVSSSGIRRLYDREVKGNIYILEGVPTTNKIRIPKHAKQSLCLVQNFLILQIYLNKGQDFALELGVTDLGNNKRRVMLTSSQREVQVTPLHAKIPLACVVRGTYTFNASPTCRTQWLNLCLDVPSLVGGCWNGETHKSIDSITVAANCRLRRVFTMRSQPADTSHMDDPQSGDTRGTGGGIIEHIPHQCHLSLDVPQVTQVLTMDRIRGVNRTKSGSSTHGGSLLDLDLTSRSASSQQSDEFHIAFGYKVASAPPGKLPKDGISSNRSVRSNFTQKASSFITGGNRPLESSFHGNTSARSDKSQKEVKLKERPFSDTSIQTKGGAQGKMIQPYPPREPSTERNRRRIRLKGQIADNITSVPNKISSMEQMTTVHKQRQYTGGGEANRDDTAQDTGGDRNKGDSMVDDTMMDVIDMLKGTNLGVSHDASLYSSPNEQNATLKDESDIYLFSSPPKSANKRLPSPSLKAPTPLMPAEIRQVSYSRGPRLEDDFIVSESSSRSSGCEESSDDARASTYGEEDSTERLDGVESTKYRITGRDKDVVGNIASRLMKGYENYDSSRYPDNLGEDGMERKTDGEFVSGIQHYSVENLLNSRVQENKPGIFRDDMDSDKSNKNSVLCTQTVPIADSASRCVKLGPQIANLSPRINSANRCSGLSAFSYLSASGIDENTRTSLTEPRKKNFRDYEVCDVTESYETRMLASMKRHDEMGSSPRIGVTANNVRCLKPYGGDSPVLSEEETSYSTWKAPATDQLQQNYVDEMTTGQSHRSSDTLTSSNPRDWSAVFSPPVNKTSHQLESTNENAHDHVTEDTLDMGDNSTLHDQSSIDLLYDPLLNCYYHPDTGKYYELV